MSIKLTTACIAGGLSALMFVAVSGLEYAELKLKNKSEFANYKGLYLIKIKGLSLDSSANPNYKQHCYLIFTQKLKGKKSDSNKSKIKFLRIKSCANY